MPLSLSHGTLFAPNTQPSKLGYKYKKFKSYFRFTETFLKENFQIMVNEDQEWVFMFIYITYYFNYYIFPLSIIKKIFNNSNIHHFQSNLFKRIPIPREKD